MGDKLTRNGPLTWLATMLIAEQLPKLKIPCPPRQIRFCVISLILAVLVQTTSASQSEGPSDVLTETAASKLLDQVAEGLRGHSARKLLSAFDLSHMEDGPLFAEQITAFFNQYDSIRVHFKLTEVKENVAIVDAEMDATPHDSANPPEHKTVELHLSAEKTHGGWRFIDVQPRDFFS